MPRFKRILLAHTAVVAATLAVGLMLAFAGISYYLITRQSTGLEIQETKDRVRGIVNEMSQPLKTLQARANDWAARDQTSQFIGNSAPSGTDAQLQQDSFHDLQADVILLLNPKGHLVYSRFFDPQKHQLIAEDSEVLQTISDKTTFVQALRGYGRVMGNGYLLTGSGRVLLMAAAPVVTSANDEPIGGMLVLGLYLDTKVLTMRGRDLGLSILLHPYHAAQTKVAAEVIARECLTSAEPCARAITTDTVAGYTILRDPQGEPALTLEVLRGRATLQAALSLWRQQTGFLVVLICGCFIVLLGLLYRLVFKRLTRLTTEAESMSENNMDGARISSQGKDEISELAGRINAMLEALEQCRDIQRDNEQYLKNLLESINCGILIVDAQERVIVDINAAGAAMLGRVAGDILGKTEYEAIDSPGEDRVLPSARPGYSGIGERVLFHVDGTALPVLSSVATVTRRGKPCLIISFIDISGLKKAEHDLKESEAKYRQFFEEDLTGNFISSNDGSILDCNLAFASMLGYHSVEEAKNSNMFYHYFSREDRLAIQARLQEKKTVIRHQWTLRHLNGDPLYCIGNLIGVFDDQGNLVQARCYVFDDTRRVMLEKERRQNQKMEAIGTLAGGIAHDFNNILAGIIGFTELIVRDLADRGTPVIRLYLDNILSAGDRATDLIKQILAFSRQSEVELRPVHLKQAVEEVVQLMRASLPATITIEHTLKSDAVVMADQVQIHQIIMNLCTNAGHAMKETGGLLVLGQEDITLDQRFTSQYQDLEPGDYVRISVSDTGEGIEDHVVEHIFDPFFTTRAKGEGTGLGLSLVHGIVSEMKGLITVDSTPGQGTRFEIYLPRIDAVVEDVTGEEDGSPTGTERIVFVEDDLFLMEIGKEILAGLGYQVTGFSGGAEALQYILDHADQVDLVVTDMVMPHVGGLDLSAKIQQEDLQIPIILCTGHSEGLTREHVALFGVCDFLAKPVTVHTLAVKVRTVLDRCRGIGNT